MGNAIKRWAPLIGSGVLAIIVVLRLLGFEDYARAVEFFGGVTGLTNGAAVGITELTAAVATIFGLVRKFKAIKDAKVAENKV